jgi:tetratricopeptide (TPR) repeat protein
MPLARASPLWSVLWLMAAGCGGAAGNADTALTAPDSLSALLSAGEVYYGNGQLDSALAVFTAAVVLSRERGDPDGEAGGLVWSGTLAYRRDDYPEARRLLGEALALQHRHGLRTHLWRTNNVLGLVAYLEGRYFDALERHGAAAQLAEAAGDTISLAKSWNNVALARIELGDYAEARALLLRALPVARAGGQTLIEGRVLVNLGMLAVRTGELEAAFGYLEEARRPLGAAGDRDGEQNRLGQLGTAYAAIGEPGLAIAWLDTALAEARAQESPQEVASNLEHMAGVYRDAGDYPRALRLYQEARALNDTLGLEDEAGFDLRHVAEIQFELGNLDPARRSARSALDIHRRLGDRLDVMHGLLLLARIARAAGEPAAARGHLAEARAIATALDARAARLAVALTAARMADAARDNEGVIRELAAIEPDLAAGATDVVWEVHWLLSRAQARRGAWAKAARTGQRAVEAVERVRGEFGSGQLRNRYQTARQAVYQDQVEVLLRLDRVEEAFEIADAARGRVLLDHLATVRTDRGSTARELAEEERQLLRQIDGMTAALDRLKRGGAGENPDDFRAELDRMVGELDRIRTEYGAALIRAEERLGAARALAGGTRPSAAAVRAALHPGEALVEFLLLPDQVLVFVMTSAGTAYFREAADRRGLAARIRVVRELTGRPGTDGAGGALEALHEKLLGGARRSGVLNVVHTLILIPHGELEYVPFAGLRDAATGRYLVEDFTLLHLPSAGALAALRNRPTVAAAAGSALALAPFPAELPGSLIESRLVAELLPGSRLRRGRDATERALRTALGSGRVVHLATHGVLNPRNPLFSRLELYPGPPTGSGDDDGRLEVHEVSRMVIDARLVFLSGCETGLGVSGSTGFSTGEDYATLTRAFLSAGAANVIATLWQVRDRGAAELAARFYREVARSGGASGEALAHALSRAQRELLRDPAWAAPFYWAGFRITGGGETGAKAGAPVRS